jgi:nitroimidazol reductase NimA-like FMN-containing flavoprotein (pyridoxamine 5'-phosphate oxidase superfamily)
MEQDLKVLALEVLKDGFLFSLATVDDGGVWVAPVTYIHDENLCLYWVSYPSTRHSKAIEQNSKVAGTVIATFEPKKERGLQMAGVAEVLDEPPVGYEQLIEKKSGNDELVRTGKLKEKGYVWYRFTPTLVELIHNEKFGYEKKGVV